MARLTIATVRGLTKPGRYSDDGTLFLNVAKGGSKSWVQRLTINGKRHDIGLGGYPLTSLKEARDKAFASRKLARDGGDPLAAKRKARVPTFRQAADRTFEANRRRWRSETTARNWNGQLERHAFPVLGDTLVTEIGREDVLRVLTPIWSRHPDIARKLRGRIRSTLAWCQAHGYIEHNVAGDAIDGALPPMPAVAAHYRALPHREVAEALEIIESTRASLSARACLRWVVLTACRSGEARGATWAEIDVEARLWRVPASRMKTGAEHRVPLPDEALEVLERVRPLRDDAAGLVFPSPVRSGKPLSNMSMTKLLRDCGLADRTTVHGLRSSFRDWCAEEGKPREVAEAALAHTVGGVEGSYFRSDLFERRRRLMDQWAAYVTDAAPAKVVAFRNRHDNN